MIRKSMEYTFALLKKDDGVNTLYIFVTELIALSSAYAFVLTKQQICRIAGAALPRKLIPDLLNLGAVIYSPTGSVQFLTKNL